MEQTIYRGSLTGALAFIFGAIVIVASLGSLLLTLLALVGTHICRAFLTAVHLHELRHLVPCWRAPSQLRNVVFKIPVLKRCIRATSTERRPQSSPWPIQRWTGLLSV